MEWHRLAQHNWLRHGLLFALASHGSKAATQSCTGSLFCLPGKAETQQAATQQNAVLHGLFVLLARGGSNTNGKHHGHPARRSSSTTVRYGANPGRLGGTPCCGIVHWESTPTSMFGHHRDTHVCMERCIPAHASVACRRRCTARTHGPHPHATCRVRRALHTLSLSHLGQMMPEQKKMTHIQRHIHSSRNEILPDGSMRYEKILLYYKRKSPLLFEYKSFKTQYKIQY